MAAVGRKRKGGERTASGRLSRSLRDDLGAYPPAAVKRLADAAMRGMADREWGTPIGRMFLQGELTPIEFEAGRRWDSLSVLYMQAIGAPSPHPRAAAVGRAQGGAPSDPDSEEGRAEARRHRQTMDGWIGAMVALTKIVGPRSRDIVRAVCEHHHEPRGDIEREQLRFGLNALAEWWELTKEVL